MSDTPELEEPTKPTLEELRLQEEMAREQMDRVQRFLALNARQQAAALRETEGQ